MKNLKLSIALRAVPFSLLLISCGGSGSSSPSVSDPVISDNATTITAEGISALLDQDTELQTGIQGFTVEKIYIIDANDKRISKNEIALNTSFSIVYEGVKNYTLKDGNAFPELSIQVMNNEQITVLSQSDLLASYEEGLSEENASVLRATITVGDPMKAGKYMCSVQVADKNNPNSTILSSWEFDVK